MERTFALIKDNKVVNVVVGTDGDVAVNPTNYIECTNGWDFNNGIDPNGYFYAPVLAEPKEIDN